VRVDVRVEVRVDLMLKRDDHRYVYGYGSLFYFRILPPENGDHWARRLPLCSLQIVTLLRSLRLH
jgi:hypothetical protein